MPVTLDLSGKCPALLTADSADAASVRSVVGTKPIKNGQMCISVDHVLAHRPGWRSSSRTPRAT